MDSEKGERWAVVTAFVVAGAIMPARATTIDDEDIARFGAESAAFDVYQGELGALMAERTSRLGTAERRPAGASMTTSFPARNDPTALMSSLSRGAVALASPPLAPASVSATAGAPGPGRAAAGGRELTGRSGSETTTTTSGAGTSTSTTSIACSLFAPGAERVAAQDCMTCHGLTRTHSVEVDYAAAAARRPEFYRTPQEVIRRGVFLPDGQIKCVTCHDPASPWKYKIALPPGAPAIAGVDFQRPETFEGKRVRNAAVAPLPPGSTVTPTPLCQACHTYGD